MLALISIRAFLLGRLVEFCWFWLWLCICVFLGVFAVYWAVVALLVF